VTSDMEIFRRKLRFHTPSVAFWDKMCCQAPHLRQPRRSCGWKGLRGAVILGAQGASDAAVREGGLPEAALHDVALWSCLGSGWQRALNALGRMREAGVDHTLAHYFVAALEEEEDDEADQLLSLFFRMERSRIEVNMPGFLSLLMHLTAEARWPSLRAAAQSRGIVLPIWRWHRRLQITTDWYGRHVLRIEELSRSWLDLLRAPGVPAEDAGTSLLRPGRGRNRRWSSFLATREVPDFSDAAVRYNYTRFRLHRTWYLPMALLTPEADFLRERFFDRKSLQVLDIGGGPGSVALGLHVFAEIFAWSVHIEHHVVDFEPGWAESVGHLRNVLGKQTPRSLQDGDASGPSTSVSFHRGDVLAKSLPERVPKASHFDLFVFSYVLYDNAAALLDADYGVLPHLLCSAKQGAVFVFMDHADRLWPKVASLAEGLSTFRVTVLLVLSKFWLILEKVQPRHEHAVDRCTDIPAVLELIDDRAIGDRKRMLKSLLKDGPWRQQYAHPWCRRGVGHSPDRHLDSNIKRWRMKRARLRGAR